jgi:hypothetical protein
VGSNPTPSVGSGKGFASDLILTELARDLKVYGEIVANSLAIAFREIVKTKTSVLVKKSSAP